MAEGEKKEGKRSEEETVGTTFLPEKSTGKTSFLSFIIYSIKTWCPNIMYAKNIDIFLKKKKPLNILKFCQIWPDITGQLWLNCARKLKEILSEKPLKF